MSATVVARVPCSDVLVCSTARRSLRSFFLGFPFEDRVYRGGRLRSSPSAGLFFSISCVSRRGVSKSPMSRRQGLGGNCCSLRSCSGSLFSYRVGGQRRSIHSFPSSGPVIVSPDSFPLLAPPIELSCHCDPILGRSILECA